MIDLLSLRNALETALSSELGTYTFTNGQTTTAIAVDDGSGEYPPPGTEVTGLECVIVASPEVQTESLLGNAFKETYTAAIILKQWDADKTVLNARLLARDAIAELDDIGMVSGSMRRILPFAKLNNIETFQMTVYQSFFEEVDE